MTDYDQGFCFEFVFGKQVVLNFKKENLIFEKSKLFKTPQGKTVWIKNKFNRNLWKQIWIKSKASKVVTEIKLERYQDKLDCEIQIWSVMW